MSNSFKLRTSHVKTEKKSAINKQNMYLRRNRYNLRQCDISGNKSVYEMFCHNRIAVTMRTNLLNWCNLVSISKNLRLFGGKNLLIFS